MNKLDQLAQQAIAMLRQGLDDDHTYVKVRDLYMEIKYNPASLKTIDSPREVAMALNILLSYGIIDDIDVRQRISSISYFLTSTALRKTPLDKDLYKDRVHNIILNKEAFGYTVSEVIEDTDDFMSFHMGLSFFHKRDAIIKMEMYDFSMGGTSLIQLDKVFSDEFIKNMEMIRKGTLGDNADIDTIISEGGKLHEKIYSFLEEKLIENEDIDF